jgi:hypothetical protein
MKKLLTAGLFATAALLAATATFGAGATHVAPATCDVNGDGTADVVITGGQGTTLVAVTASSSGAGQLQVYTVRAAWIAAQGNGFCIVQIDETGDGQTDWTLLLEDRNGDGDFGDKGDRWALNPVNPLADKVTPAPHRGR